MPDLPTRPSIPDVPRRTQPSTFQARADKWLSFMAGGFADYVGGMLDFAAPSLDDAEALAAASDLSGADITDYADDWLFVNEAGDGVEMRAATEVQIATQPEAEAGEVATKVMSPLRTRQAMEALAATSPWALIVTKTANNSASLAFTEFDATKYVDYQFRFRNLLTTLDPRNIHVSGSDDGGTTLTTIRRAGQQGWVQGVPFSIIQVGAAGADEPGASGTIAVFNLHADKGAHAIVRAIFVDLHGAVRSYESAAMMMRPSTNSPINYVKFNGQNSSLASGSITLYGRRI